MTQNDLGIRRSAGCVLASVALGVVTLGAAGCGTMSASDGDGTGASGASGNASPQGAGGAISSVGPKSAPTASGNVAGSGSVVAPSIGGAGTIGSSAAIPVSSGGSAPVAGSTGASPTGAGSAPISATTPANPGAYDTIVSKGEFSFFITSLAFIKSKADCTGTTANSGKTCTGGLGGKLGGLDGADQLCTEAARAANPGDNHQWRAFLSVTSYNGGAAVNAIDRIGVGPWYTAPPKLQKATSYANGGLLVAADLSGLLQGRPNGDTTTIVYTGVNQSQGQGTSQNWPLSQCLTNEVGDCVQVDGDTHDTLTGSSTAGKLFNTDKKYTCDDWTNSTTGYGSPAFGHSWPRQLGATDGSAGWINTGETGEIGCGAIINVGTTNYMSGGGGGGKGGGSSSTWSGGVGSAGGYGAFYCFAYVTGSE